MARTGCGVQPCMLVLHGFAPATDMTSRLVVNLLEISPIIHQPSSLLHKEIKFLLLTALAGGCLYSLQTHVSAQSLTGIFLLLFALMWWWGNSSWEHPQLDASWSVMTWE